MVKSLAILMTAALQVQPQPGTPLIDSKRERLALRGEIARLFERGQLAALEGRVKQLRSTRPRFSSGLPMLWDFYKAFDPGSDHIGGPLKDSYAERLTRWEQRDPASFIAKMAAINACEYRAWKARGEGAASTVSPEAWVVYRREQEKAWSLAEAAERLEAKDPILYNKWIHLCTASERPWAEVDRLLRTMIAIDPTFDQGYIAVANYLMPRWHGSAAKLHEFALRAVAETRNAMGPGMYARIAIVPALQERGKIVREYPFDYKLIKEAFEDLDKRYPNSGRTINFYAWFAMTYGDIPTARRLMDRIGRHWTQDGDEVWGSRAIFDRYHAAVGALWVP